MELLDRIGLIMVICAMLVTVKRDADYLVKKQRKSRDSHEIAKDEPQTDCLEQFRVGLEYHTDTTHFGKAKGENVTTNKIEDESQTDCPWK